MLAPMPWVPPPAPTGIIKLFEKYGEIKSYDKGDLIVAENYLQKLFIVTKGLLKNSVPDFTIKKPFMTCGVRLPCQITGYTTYMVRQPAPLYITALEKSEISILSFNRMDELLQDNEKLKIDLLRYCGQCLRSDIDAVLVITSMQSEECFWIFYTSIFLSLGCDISKEWLTLPFKITREDLSDIIYCSMLTTNRVYSSLTKNEQIVKKNGRYLFSGSEVRHWAEWIDRRLINNDL